MAGGRKVRLVYATVSRRGAITERVVRPYRVMPAERWVSEERWHPSQRVEALPDGAVRFRMRVPVTGDLVLWVLGYGGRVAVNARESLRRVVAAEAERALAVARGEAAPYPPTPA